MAKRKFTRREREAIYARYSGKCAICGNHVSFKRFTIDHKLPVCKGGTNDFRNLQSVCYSCNKMKHNLTWNEFMKKSWKVTMHNLWNIAKTYLKGGGLP